MARQREVEDDGGTGGATVMVGGMDELLGKNDSIEIEIEETEEEKKAKRPVVADIDGGDEEEGDERFREAQEDARLAYDDSATGSEERLSRRSRRNRARREAIAGRDAEIMALHQKIEHLTGVIQGVTKGQANMTLSTIDSQLGAAQQALQMADEELARAVANSDGEKFREIQKLRDEASARVFQLSNAKQRMAYELQAGGPVPQGQQTRGQQQAQQTISPKATEYTEKFLSRFTYFDPNGTDEDSMIIRSIDDAVAAEGYRPDTPMYWRTLEERLAKRGFFPEKSRDDADDDNDSDDAPRPPAQRQAARAGMPPTSTGRSTRRSGGTTFQLDPMMRDYLSSEGLLEQNLDPESKARRDRLIQQWRSNAQRAKRGDFNRT